MNSQRILTDFRKGIAATTAAAGVCVASGLLSGAAERWTDGVIAAVGAALVVLVPNGPTKKAAPAAPAQPAAPAA